MYNINPLGCLGSGSGRKSWSPGMRKDDALSRATGRGGSPEGIAEESAKGKVRWNGMNTLEVAISYPLVNLQKAIENGNL